MNDEPTVFVVDDDAAIRQSLAAMIGALFPRVETYASAAEFLEAFHPDGPGCLVLDVALPGMSGLELHRKFVAEKIELPVVFITGYGNVPMAVEAMRNGAVDFLEKPFHEHQLWESVRKALEVDAQNRRRKARRREVEERLAVLNAGERDVLHWMMEGKGNREIAEILKLSVRTIEDRRGRVMRKMETKSLSELIQMVMTH